MQTLTVDVIVDRPARGWQADLVQRMRGVADVVVTSRSADSDASPARSYVERASRVSAALRPVDLATEGPPRSDADLTVHLAQRPPNRADGGRLGLWQLVVGDGPPDAPGLLEMIEGTPVHARLVDHAGPRPQLLREGWFLPSPYRYAHHVDATVTPASELVLQQLEAVRLDPTEAARPGRPAPPRRPLTPHQVRTGPLHIAGRACRRMAQSVARRASWDLGVVDRPVHTLVHGGTLADPDITWIPLTVHHGYLADPFSIVVDDTPWIFAERFDFATRFGRLVAFALEDGDPLRPTEPVAVFPSAHHQSFPFLFDHEGDHYCVIERSAEGCIPLYRCTGWPDRWERLPNLLDMGGVDTVVFRHDGRWWLTTSLGQTPGRDLHAYFADALTGPWHPHPLNPIVSDVASARNAGPPIVVDGQLVRFGQDEREGYGAATQVLRVDRLDPRGFHQTPLGSIRPDPHGRCPDGVHTVSALDARRTLVDGKRFGFDRVHTQRQLRYAITRR